MPDWELSHDPLAALHDGDPGPFEAFVRSHTRIFFAFFRRQGAGLHRAEDLTQDVFLKLYNHAPRYREQERFQALCFRIARNVWIDDRRRAAARGAVRPAEAAELADSGDLAYSGPGRAREAGLLAGGAGNEALDRMSTAEEADRLRLALRDLPETHRAVFELGVIEEMGYGDIAKLLDIPVGTVKSRMYHAVRKLRTALGEEQEGAA